MFLCDHRLLDAEFDWLLRATGLRVVPLFLEMFWNISPCLDVPLLWNRMVPGRPCSSVTIGFCLGADFSILLLVMAFLCCPPFCGYTSLFILFIAFFFASVLARQAGDADFGFI
jgi:hypothetical protein